MLELFEGNEAFLFNILALLLGALYGVIAQRSQFCFSGGLKDLFVSNDTKRIASIAMSMLVAIIATQLIVFIYELDLSQTRYFANINYAFIIIGGAMFGYGMMRSDGCGSRHLVKFAQGDIKSLYILLSIGASALGAFYFLRYFGADMRSLPLLNQLETKEAFHIAWYIPVGILLTVLVFSVKKISHLWQCCDGWSIGLIVALGWYTTTVVADELFYLVSAQSLSFVYPNAQIIEMIATLDFSVLSFGMMSVFGVLIGAFLSSKIRPKYNFQFQCFDESKKPPNLTHKLIAGAFLGIGGVLTVGCTVGQGLSGLSSLSFASFLSISSIYISGYITAYIMNKNNQLLSCFIFTFEEKFGKQPA